MSALWSAARKWLWPGFLAVSGYLIWRQLSGIRPQAIFEALLSAPPAAVFASLLFNGGSYACLSVTEWLSARALGRRLAFGQAAGVAIPAYALTNTAGFGPITGTALRIKFYGRVGLSAKAAAAVAMLAGAAVSLSGVVTFGVSVLIAPDIFAGGARWLALTAGMVAIAPGALWFVAFAPWAPQWLGRRRDSLGLPKRFAALAAGCGDWLLSGLGLFVLLAGTPLQALPGFLAGFCVAGLLSAVAGVPGGIGVFEALILMLTAHISAIHQTAAALLLYRCLYSFLPLASVGALGLARRLLHLPLDSAARRRPGAEQ